MAEQGGYQQNSLDARGFSIWTKNDQGKSASFSIGFAKNGVRFRVWTNVDSDKDRNRGVITGDMDPVSFSGWLADMRRNILYRDEAKGEYSNHIVINRPAGKNDSDQKRAVDGVVPSSDLWYGVDKDGMVWVSLTAYNRPAIKFPLCFTKFTHLKHKTGEMVAMREASSLYSDGWLAAVERQFHLVLHANFQPAQPASAGGNSYQRNSGGYGNSNNNRGSYQQNDYRGGSSGGSSPGGGSTDFEEDQIPF